MPGFVVTRLKVIWFSVLQQTGYVTTGLRDVGKIKRKNQNSLSYQDLTIRLTAKNNTVVLFTLALL